VDQRIEGAAGGEGAGGAARRMDAIVRRAQSGDVDAFELVYRSHASAIHALCRRMCGDDSEARELVQDVFVRAWERLPGFRGESALGTWMHRVAVNVVLEKWRAAKRDALRMIDDREGAELERATAPPDLDTAMDVATATASLPPGARIVFVLHDVEGYTHDEIAVMTGIAAGTSRAQLFRARRALARILK